MQLYDLTPDIEEQTNLQQYLKQMQEEGKEIVWSFQCYMSVNSFGSYETMPAFFTHEQKLKGVKVGEGARNVAKWMNQYDVFTVGGSDIFSPGLVERIKEDLTCNVKAGFTAVQALKHWTGNAGIVLKWSGPKNPYPTYELGTIKEGAYADLLLWDGNPLEKIDLILDESKLHFVMKDGLTYKNTLVDVDSPIFRPAKTPPTRGQDPGEPAPAPLIQCGVHRYSAPEHHHRQLK